MNYKQEITRTMSPLERDIDNYLHMAIGMITELSELSEAYEKGDEANFNEEVGDFYWFLENFDNLIEEKSEEISKNSLDNKDPAKRVLDLLDDLKAWLAYGKKVEDVILHSHYQKIKYSMEILLKKLKIDNLKEILEININKLKTRYPEKFDSEKAINRNLEEERKVIENS